MKVSFNVKGMHCASCALKVEKSLKSVKGVSSASVNPVNNVATIDYNPVDASISQLKDAVKKSGAYEVQ